MKEVLSTRVKSLCEETDDFSVEIGMCTKVFLSNE